MVQLLLILCKRKLDAESDYFRSNSVFLFLMTSSRPSKEIFLVLLINPAGLIMKEESTAIEILVLRSNSLLRRVRNEKR